MPLFIRDGKSILYLHVPKTGGTAIEGLLQNNGFRTELFDTGARGSFNRWRRCPPQHMEAQLVDAILRPARCDYVFLTVRDPLERLLSEYRMRARTTPDIAPLPKWFEWALKRVAEDPYAFENHLRPQVDFWLPVAECFRYEDGLDRVVNRLSAQPGLELQNAALPELRPEVGVPIPAADIDNVRSRVRQVYWRDYASFGY